MKMQIITNYDTVVSKAVSFKIDVFCENSNEYNFITLTPPAASVAGCGGAGQPAPPAKSNDRLGSE